MEIQKDIYNSKVKDCIKRLKESKAAFLYDWMLKIDPKVTYERENEFFLTEFREISWPNDTEILKEGDLSKELFIVREGNFMLLKSLDSNSPLENKYYSVTRRNKQYNMMILGENSILGEDGYWGKLKNSYSLKSISTKSIVYCIKTDSFNERFTNIK